jgi:hypothetical protein
MKKMYVLMLLIVVFLGEACTKNTSTAIDKDDALTAEATITSLSLSAITSCGRICGKTVSASCYASLALCLEKVDQNCTVCAGESSCATTDNLALNCSSSEPYIIVVGPELGKPKTASGGQVSDELLTAVMGNFIVIHTLRTSDVVISVARKSDPAKALYTRQLKRIGSTNLYKSMNTTTRCTLTNTDANLVLRNLSNNTICAAFIANLYDSFVLLDKKIN